MNDIEKRLAQQLGCGPATSASGFVPTEEYAGPQASPESKMIPTYVDDRRRTHAPSAASMRPPTVPPEHVQDHPFCDAPGMAPEAKKDVAEWFQILDSYVKANDARFSALEGRLTVLESRPAVQADEKTLADLNGRIAALEAKPAADSDSIAALQARVVSLEEFQATLVK